MKDFNENTVLFDTDINWDEQTLLSGITPIKKSHYDELQEAIEVLKKGLEKHKENYIGAQHGIVNTLQSGFMTKELVKRIDTLKTTLSVLIATIPSYLVPNGIITMYDKPVNQIKPKWVWCEGKNNTIDTRSKSVLGGKTGSAPTYPINSYTNIEDGTDITQVYVDAVFQKRVN